MYMRKVKYATKRTTVAPAQFSIFIEFAEGGNSNGVNLAWLLQKRK